LEENNLLVALILDFRRCTALPVELPSVKAKLAEAGWGNAKFSVHGKYGKIFIIDMSQPNQTIEFPDKILLYIRLYIEETIDL
jgi:hypothetical protein